MRVVSCVVMAVALMTAAAIADDQRAGAMTGAREEVAEPPPQSPPPPPNHFLPRPTQILQSLGNYMHQHHQDVAAAHHASHSQHHVDAHGATPAPPPSPPPTPIQAGAAAGAVAGAAAGAAAANSGPQPPHVPRPPSHLGSHLQQIGLGGGERPPTPPPGGLLGGGGLFGHHHLIPPEPIVATRTVFVEVTKRVTRHPVCMTVYGKRPPCLPYNEYRPSPYKKPTDDSYREQDEHSFRMDADDDMDWNNVEEGYYINPTQVVKMGAASIAYPPDSGFVRSGRYIELRKAKPSTAPAATLSEPTKSEDAAVATPALEDAPLEAPQMQIRQGPFSNIGAGLSQMGAAVGSMIPQMPQLPQLPQLPMLPMGGPMGSPKPTTETRYEIKTLWVTKVERFTDYRVTATLVAENCVPTDSKIPFCNSGYSGPSYDGGDSYATPYTEKPHIYTTPTPPKKPHGPPPPPPRPHLGGLLHRPRPTPPAVPAYKPVPAPDPAPYAPEVAYEKPYAPAPAPAYSPAPAPAPAYPPAPAPAPAYPPAPAPAYPPLQVPAYPQPPVPALPPPPTYPPPPAEPTYDYPVDTQHWKETEQSHSEEVAINTEESPS